jgi:hypothetical protein
VLCIKRSDVKWLSAGHELVIGNELFDVKEFAYTDKGLIVKGLFDSAETSLHKKNDDLYAGGKSRQGLIFLKYLQLVANCFYYPERGLIKLPVPVPRERIGFPDTYYSNIYLQIPSPPPKCFYSRSV